MPVVPVREPSTVTTDVNATAVRSPLGDAAAALGVVGDTLGAESLNIQLRENADLVMQAEISLRDAERERRVEIESRKGVDSFGVTKESDAWWQEQINSRSGDLKNDAQREMFEKIAQERRQVSLNTISGYEASERRNSFNQSSAALIENAINDAVESAFNPDAVAIEVERVKDAIADLSGSNGWSKEQSDNELEKQLTTLHGSVISSLMADSPLAAQEYFKQHRDEISGTARADLDALIKAKLIDEEAQGLAETFYTGEDSYTDAGKKIRAIKDPALQKATRAAVNALHGDEVVARRADQTANAEAIWKGLFGGGSLSDVLPITLENITSDDRLRMQAYEKAKTAAKINPLVADNLDVLSLAQRAIEDGDIQSVQELEEFRPHLRLATFNSLISALKKETAGIPQKDILTAYEERIGKKRTAVGTSDGFDEDDQDSYLELQEYVNKRAREGATSKDLEDLVDRWFITGRGASDRFFTDDPDTFGESQVAGRTDFIIKTPDRDRRVIDNVVGQINAALPEGASPLTSDEYYTTVGFDAIRFLSRRGIDATPERIAAYGELKNNGERLSLRNIEAMVGSTNAN